MGPREDTRDGDGPRRPGRPRVCDASASRSKGLADNRGGQPPPAPAWQGDGPLVQWLLTLLVLAAFVVIKHNFDPLALHVDPDQFNWRGQGFQAAQADLLRRIVFVVMLAVGLTATFWSGGRPLKRPGPTLVLLAAYLTVCGISLFWARDALLTGRRLFALAATLALALGCVRRLDDRGLLTMCLAAALFSLALGVGFELWHGVLTLGAKGYRLAGTLGPNQLGAVAAVGLTAAVALFPGAKRPRLLALWAALLLAGLLLTRSRTCLLAALLGIGLVVLLAGDLKRWIIFLAGGLALTSLALLTAEVWHGDMEGWLEQSLRFGSDTQEGRLHLWSYLTDYVLRQPLRGVGYNSFWDPATVDLLTRQEGWLIPTAHSSYLDALLGTGFPGALLFMAMLAALWLQATIRQIGSQGPLARWAVALLTFVILNSLTESISININQVSYFFWTAALALCFPIDRAPADRPRS